MIFNELELQGSYLIELEKQGDNRGWFARYFCNNEYNDLGLDTNIVQANVSYSKSKGTLRGIHYQLSPKAETKIVRCLSGSFYDVIVDLRKESPTYLKWCGAEISSENCKMMYVPKGFGHSFITLENNTEAFYMVTEFYSPEHERTARWDDPLFIIKWPIGPAEISDKDQSAKPFDESYHLMLL